MSDTGRGQETGPSSETPRQWMLDVIANGAEDHTYKLR